MKHLLVIPSVIFQMWCLFGDGCGVNSGRGTIKKFRGDTEGSEADYFFWDEFILSVCCRPVFVASLFLRQPELQVLHDKSLLGLLLKLVGSIFINSSE